MRATAHQQTGRWARVMALPAVLIALLLAGLSTPALADVCQCRRTAAGACERWRQPHIRYTIWAPAEVPDGITNDQLHAEVDAAFAQWQAVQCGTCSRTVGDQCAPVACDANPFGVDFEFDGFSAQATLATQCLAADAPSPCPGAAANTVQIAFIRNDADWPLANSKVTQTVLTVMHNSGTIIDADILLRDSKHAFCIDHCGVGQYPLRAVLLREIGHLLGLGDGDGTTAVMAANYQPGANVGAELSAPDIACACDIYRASADLADCSTPVTAPAIASCQMAPPAGRPATGWLLAGIAGLLAIVLAARYGNGRSASVPKRRA